MLGTLDRCDHGRHDPAVDPVVVVRAVESNGQYRESCGLIRTSSLGSSCMAQETIICN